MPKLYIGDERIRKVYIGNDRIKKIYIGENLVFSDSHVVTYHINTNDIRQVEVDDGENALDSQWAPTATLSGFTFVGWRQDTQANPSVLPSKTVTEDNIHLYAVFSRVLTLTYNGNGATSGITPPSTGTQYYNNGNYNNPTITTRSNGYGKTDYRFDYWNIGSASGTVVAAGQPVTISHNMTAYAHWSLSYYPDPAQWTIGTLSNRGDTDYVTWGGPRYVTSVTPYVLKYGNVDRGYIPGTGDYIDYGRPYYRLLVYGITDASNPAGSRVLLATKTINTSASGQGALWPNIPVNGSYAGICIYAEYSFTLNSQPNSQGSWLSWAIDYSHAGTYGGMTFTF